MRVIDSGLVYDAARASAGRASNAFTGGAAPGTVLFRSGAGTSASPPTPRAGAKWRPLGPPRHPHGGRWTATRSPGPGAETDGRPLVAYSSLAEAVLTQGDEREQRLAGTVPSVTEPLARESGALTSLDEVRLGELGVVVVVR